MTFNLSGIPWCEPAFANVTAEAGSEVHGVAFCMNTESVNKLDSVEQGYLKTMVTLTAYDGRTLKGFVYTKDTDKEDMKPSSRYLGVLCKGNK